MTEAPERATGEGGGEVVVISLDGPYLRVRRVVLVTTLLWMAIIAGFMTGRLAWGVGWGRPAQFGLFVILPIFGAFVAANYLYEWVRRGRIAKKGIGDDEALLRAVRPGLLPLRMYSGLRYAAGALVGRGRSGTVYVVGTEQQVLSKSAVLEIPFEPVEVNEGHPDFQALARAVEDSGSTKEKAANAMEGGGGLTTAVRRNVKVKGGWLIAGVFVLNLVIQLFESISRGRVTWQFWVWLLGLAAIVLFPARPLWGATTQALIVPGAVAIRRSGSFTSRWTSRLFPRVRSVLILVQVNRTMWSGIVADEAETRHWMMTRDEAAVVLAAWRSPLASPEPGGWLDEL